MIGSCIDSLKEENIYHLSWIEVGLFLCRLHINSFEQKNKCKIVILLSSFLCFWSFIERNTITHVLLIGEEDR